MSVSMKNFIRYKLPFILDDLGLSESGRQFKIAQKLTRMIGRGIENDSPDEFYFFMNWNKIRKLYHQLNKSLNIKPEIHFDEEFNLVEDDVKKAEELIEYTLENTPDNFNELILLFSYRLDYYSDRWSYARQEGSNQSFMERVGLLLRKRNLLFSPLTRNQIFSIIYCNEQERLSEIRWYYVN